MSQLYPIKCVLKKISGYELYEELGCRTVDEIWNLHISNQLNLPPERSRVIARYNLTLDKWFPCNMLELLKDIGITNDLVILRAAMPSLLKKPNFQNCRIVDDTETFFTLYSWDLGGAYILASENKDFTLDDEKISKLFTIDGEYI